MFVVLGATGHVGSAVADELLRAGEKVTVAVRNGAKADHWQPKRAKVAVVDVRDVDALRAVLRTGKRASLLNPPAPVSGDTDMEERQTVSAIVEAGWLGVGEGRGAIDLRCADRQRKGGSQRPLRV